MVDHMRALERIAARHGGNRSAGTPGHRASARYVAARLRAAGFRARLQRVPLPSGSRERATFNVIGELAAGGRRRPGRGEVVIAGGHLDSVPEGPGINDNGSGTAALLETAEELTAGHVEPQRPLRLAFWGAEEIGLLGSEHFVAGLSARARRRVRVYLNLDMVGSGNAGRFFYRGGRGAAGRGVIRRLERLVRRQLAASRVPIQETNLDGLSDHAPFAEAGIPVFGLYSGGFEQKTPAHQRAFGGRAGRPFDPCWHKACDTLARVDRRSLEQLTDAAAVAIHHLITPRQWRFRASPRASRGPA
jgi:aminopeptidase S